MQNISSLTFILPQPNFLFWGRYFTLCCNVFQTFRKILMDYEMIIFCIVHVLKSFCRTWTYSRPQIFWWNLPELTPHSGTEWGKETESSVRVKLSTQIVRYDHLT
jgi:hypothetical protein